MIRTDKETELKIIDMYKQYYLISDIAEKFNLSKKTIPEIIRRNNKKQYGIIHK